MSDLHWPHWPTDLPRHLTLPQTNLVYNAEVSARRFPDKPFIIYYDTPLSFSAFLRQVEQLAGYLEKDCGVQTGDRVLLYMQNSPQWVIGYYAILRANAVVIPVNPMNKADELGHYIEDTDATVALVAQNLMPEVEPWLHAPQGATLRHAVVATYSDYITEPTDLRLPDFVASSRIQLEAAGMHGWLEALAADRTPSPCHTGPDDLCVMPYTSGTTGKPKGCMHTHRSAMSTGLGGMVWFGRTQDATMLSVLPFFHVTGMAGGMNGPLMIGATIVIMTRWDREVAAELMQRYRITSWQAISTMVVDFLANPAIAQYDLSALNGIRGGGAAMPKAVAQKLYDLTGLHYVEGYGMSETLAATHINPPRRPKPQCLGIPVFDVDARIIDPQTLEPVAIGESGEIVVNAPQVMQGYWRNDEANEKAFITIDGKRFLRTGDLARVDEEGYFFMTDRLKRMINASGYKVWPAEVESMMYQHPAIHEVCVIGAKDPKRGETVKALIVLRADAVDTVSEQAIVDWAHEHMAAYKVPRLVRFVDALPKSGSGKIMWRELQEQQNASDAQSVTKES